MAQETNKIDEINWWGLPVGLAFMVAGVVGTWYCNQGVSGALTIVIGAAAFLGLIAGIVAFGAFVFSIITREVGKAEAKHAHSH